MAAVGAVDALGAWRSPDPNATAGLFDLVDRYVCQVR
jgi:hypothetical protein